MSSSLNLSYTLYGMYCKELNEGKTKQRFGQWFISNYILDYDEELDEINLWEEKDKDIAISAIKEWLARNLYTHSLPSRIKR